MRTWRRLRALGALALHRSVYVLPDSPERYERVQWLAREIQREGGEATIVRAEQIDNLDSAEVVRRFREARDEDYRALAAGYRGLLRTAETEGGAGRRFVEGVARMERERDRVLAIDFFEAPGRAETDRLREAVAGQLGKPPSRAPAPPDQEATGLRGLRWVTPPRPHVDRIASAWLIKRFLDPEATILFAEPGHFPADAIPFDAPGAELSQHGADCTFETLLKGFRWHDPRLQRLAEIVHEADRQDGWFPREEARGIDAAVRGLLAALGDDQEVLTHGLVLFDGLYANLAAD